MMNENGISYLYLCPASNAVSRLLHIGAADCWNVIEDGEYIGAMMTDSVVRWLARLFANGCKPLCVFIHHLMGIDPDSLFRLLSQFDLNVYFYLHDYYSVCESYNLLDSGGRYCGGQKLSAEKCASCRCFEHARAVSADITSFFEKQDGRLTFIAPSEAAKNVWTQAFPEYSGKVKVICHQKIEGRYTGNRELLRDDSTVKIAFVGSALTSKGWDDFRRLVRNVDRRKANCEFLHFGSGGEELKGVKHIKVDFHDDMNAMISALRENKVDCVILWSIWQETYSYTYYESLAANTFVLTNSISGNIAEQTERFGNGRIFADTDELADFLNDRSAVIAAVNEFYASDKCGPMELRENSEILDLCGECGSLLSAHDSSKRPLGAFMKEKVLTLAESRTQILKLRGKRL